MSPRVDTAVDGGVEQNSARLSPSAARLLPQLLPAGGADHGGGEAAAPRCSVAAARRFAPCSSPQTGTGTERD